MYLRASRAARAEALELVVSVMRDHPLRKAAASHEYLAVGKGWGTHPLHAVRAEALELGNDEAVRKRLRVELDDVARKRALQGYEIPRDFIVEREPFSKANHLLTDSGKPATGRMKTTYAPPRPRGSLWPPAHVLLPGFVAL